MKFFHLETTFKQKKNEDKIIFAQTDFRPRYIVTQGIKNCYFVRNVQIYEIRKGNDNANYLGFVIPKIISKISSLADESD